MKIVVIASLTPQATANYLIAALKDLGHDLFVCSDLKSPLVDHLVYGAFDIHTICLRRNISAELVLFVEGGTMRLFPVGLEQFSCPTAWYGIDTHMDYAKHLLIGRTFDATFIAQQEYVSRLVADGLKQVYWLPLAFAPELLPTYSLRRTIDIAYVGSSDAVTHPVRHALLAALSRAFDSTHFGPASPSEMGAIYAAAHIVFNRSVNNDVNMRFFEAAGCGAVLVTDPIANNGLEELFEEGVHYVTYKDEPSLIKAVRDLLADPIRCARIAEASRHHVMANHTYTHRAISLLNSLNGVEKIRQVRHADCFSACLALGLMSGAVRAAANTFAESGGGLYRRVAGRMTAIILHPIATLLGIVERLRAI